MSSPSSYELIRRIGEGAYGKAMLMRRRTDGSHCVVKEVLLSKMKSRREQEWARQEVQLLRAFDHPGIVRYLDSFIDSGSLCIVMEFCDSGDLSARIASQKTAFAEELVTDWFAQLCLALKYVHDKRVIHRDIKPQNIFLMRSGQVVKLGDFGVAKTLDFTMQLARTGIGTPYYLSPEIVKSEPYNNKTDIWSLGCVLYEMLTLKYAFNANSEKQLYLNIKLGTVPPIPARYSADLRAICNAMLRKNPKDRPSMAALLKRESLRPALLKRVSPDELNTLQLKVAAPVASPSPSPAVAPSPRPKTPAAPAAAPQIRRVAVPPLNNINLNKNKNQLKRPAPSPSPSPSPSPRPGTPGQRQTPVGKAAQSTQSRLTDARRREAERAAAIKKAYEVKKRQSPAVSPLLKQQQLRKQQLLKAAQNKDLERLSKKHRELDEKRRLTYREEGWVNVLSPRSPPPSAQQQQPQKQQQQPPQQKLKPPAQPSAANPAAAAASAAASAAAAGQRAAAAGRQAADRAQRILDEFWERKRLRQKAINQAAAGIVADAAAEVAVNKPPQQLKQPSPQPQLPQAPPLSKVLQDVRDCGLPIQKMKLQNPSAGSAAASNSSSMDERRLKKELIAAKRAAWDARLADAQRLQDLPLQPVSQLIDDSNTAVGDTAAAAGVAAGRREAWEAKKPDSGFLRRLGDAPLLEGTAGLAEGGDYQTAEERQLRQAIYRTLKQLELEDDDAEELLTTLVMDEASRQTKGTPESLLEVANDFRAMLEQRQTAIVGDQKTAAHLPRARSIPESLCSMRAPNDDDKDAGIFDKATLDLTIKLRQRGRSLGDKSDDDNEEGDDEDNNEQDDDEDSEIDEVRQSMGEALCLASASSTATPSSPSPSPSVATTDWDDDDGLPMEPEAECADSSVGDAVALAERLRAQLETEIGFTKLLPAYELAGELECDDSVSVAETERRVKEVLGPRHAGVYDRLMQLVLYDNQAGQ